VKRTLKRGSKALEIVIRKTDTAGNWSRGVLVVLWPGLLSAYRKVAAGDRCAGEGCVLSDDVSTRTGANENADVKVPSGGNSGGTNMHVRCS